MAGTSCQGNCNFDSPLALKYEIRPIRGNMRNEDKGKKIKKCGTCQIRILNYFDRLCPCCNTLLRMSRRYKPRHMKHILEDDKPKITIPRMIYCDNGNFNQIIEVVVI